MTESGVAEFWNVLSFRFVAGKIAEVWNYAYDQERGRHGAVLAPSPGWLRLS